VRAIHDLGLQAGVAISPDTPIHVLRDVAAEVELVLVMSVYPGFSGQTFLEGSVPRVREVRALLDERHPQASICIDGGIIPANIGAAVAAGADNLVAAHAVYRAGVPVGEAISRLRAAMAPG
jgi:ribulose-phosphate 3-epimerase